MTLRVAREYEERAPPKHASAFTPNQDAAFGAVFTRRGFALLDARATRVHYERGRWDEAAQRLLRVDYSCPWYPDRGVSERLELSVPASQRTMALAIMLHISEYSRARGEGAWLPTIPAQSDGTQPSLGCGASLGLTIC